MTKNVSSISPDLCYLTQCGKKGTKATWIVHIAHDTYPMCDKHRGDYGKPPNVATPLEVVSDSEADTW